MPAFDLELPSSTADITAIRSYLHRLVTQLNITLNSLDEGNMNDNYQQAIQDVVTVSEKANKLAKLLDDGELAKTKSVREMYKSLRDSVFANFDNITASFNTMIDQLNNEIRTYVEANYIASDPDMTLDEKISSLIQQMADQVRMEFTTLANINAEAIDAISVLFGTYFRFSDQGMEIGKIGDGASPVVARLTNERLEFVIAGTDVVLAYFDGATNKLKINMAEIDSLSLGNDVSGYLDIDMKSAGLFLKWRS